MTNEQEPVWIRDAQAAHVDIDGSHPEKIPQMIAEICEGEKVFCEYCGAEFPIWPTKVWADHTLTEHSALLTIQARTGTNVMCADELIDAQRMFFSMLFSSRVSLRRRAWQLGFTVVKEPPRLVRPAN